jgi:hypothetical protein
MSKILTNNLNLNIIYYQINSFCSNKKKVKLSVLDWGIGQKNSGYQRLQELSLITDQKQFYINTAF